jgi:hypothetical protein
MFMLWAALCIPFRSSRMYQKSKPSEPPRNKETRHIGVPLEKAVAMVTANPARVFEYDVQIGTLRPEAKPTSEFLNCATANFISWIATA